MCRLEVWGLGPEGALVRELVLRADASDRPDHGYFSFFRFDPRSYEPVARLAWRFFERIAI